MVRIDHGPHSPSECRMASAVLIGARGEDVADGGEALDGWSAREASS